MNMPRRAFRNSRPTIGLLCDVPYNQYSCDLWAGVRDVAREKDANLLYFAGGILDFAMGFRNQANVIYERITPETLDGLVIWGGQLAHIVGAQGVETFCQRFRPLPMVSIELVLPDIPAILTDNYQGMYDLVTHLIVEHGYRRLAYINYPTSFPVTEARYRGYVDALRDHQIPLDLNLVTDGSETSVKRDKTTFNAGWEGAYILLEQRGLQPRRDIDAIVTVADPTAFSVLQHLRSRGVRIPSDVALVGFDDLAEARYQHPPLTTVRQSFYEQGRQAMTMLFAQLRGEEVPNQIMLALPVILRRSCGCADPLIGHTRLESGINGMAREKDNRRRSEFIFSTCQSQSATSNPINQACREHQMLESFLDEVKGEGSGSFSLAWENMVYEVIDGGGDLCRWREVLTEWHHRVFPVLPAEDALRAKNLWQHARIMLDALIQREQTHQQFQVTRRTHLLHSIGNALIATFDLSGVTMVLEQELSKLGINACYLALYVEAAAPTEWANLIFACDQHGRIEIPPQGRSIPPRWLMPEGMFPHDHTWSFMVAPLYFQTTQIGFALFDAGPQPPEGMVYESLRNQISSALQGALLVQRLQERTAELTREQYILETFMANVPDSIYFKDRHGRFTKSNRAHAQRLGLCDPSEGIGKSDSDFFSKDQAQQRYAQEQTIIQTGQPLLAFEEPARRGGWVLTTKMPLRDEHGQIIGTFGISHDITALKQVQARLEQAYVEIEQRVAERTAELQQEIAERTRAETEIRHLQHFLQNIIDSMPAIMMGVDLDGRVIFWNQEAVNVTELPAQAVQGKLLQEAFPPFTDQIAHIESTVQSRIPRHLSKIALRWKEKTSYVDITIYPLIANAIEGAVILVVDVTEQVRLEEMMLQSEKMWTVGGLAAGMAHEINNPLSVILQGIQNIRRRLALDVQANQAAAARIGLNLEQIHAYLEARRIWRYLQEMQTAGLHAEKIVANILNFSNDAASERRAIDMNHLLDNVLDLAANDYDLMNTYHFKDVTLLRNYEAALPRVLCIANEIEQVILNMIRNAVQALADRPANAPAPFIRLTTRREAEYVSIAIEDNGIGMDETTRKYIFDPFFTTRAVGKGSGLGLAVSYFIIVVHHHGKILVTSTPEHGAIFTLQLPIQPPASPEYRNHKQSQA